MGRYDETFFQQHLAGSLSSARTLAPMILQLVPARSSIDVGCGVGAWVKAFLDLGVDARGVDGPWVSREQLVIPYERFSAMDLSDPAKLTGRFDLATCMEVAEHLPASAANVLVTTLTGLAPVVVFSAAIPGQGGTDHINEQWQDYWTQRFAVHGHIAVDCLRSRVWDNPAVQWWYAQNAFVYASERALRENPHLHAAAADRPLPLRLVHPMCFAARAHEAQNPPARRILAALPGLPVKVGAGVLRRLRRPTPHSPQPRPDP